jgi:dTDP-4-amino-4,6-dideoxygalactose transaminase
MILKSPIDNNNFKQDIIFTNSAREGWDIVLRDLKTDAKVLLPSYIGITDREGSGIYDPVLNNKIDHDFYMLKNDLSISITELKKSLEAKEYDLILLVHYFGFRIKNLEEVVKLCKSYNLLVVEDCAHLYNYNMYELSNAGTFGDFVFYSLHKNFPIKNGGLLVQNSHTFNLKSVHLEQKFNCEKLLSYNANKIAHERIDNYKVLDKLITNISGVLPLKSLGEGDIPHTYPIIVEDNLREKLYFWLIDRDVPLIALYYRLIEPLQKEMFFQMKFISDNILNLPVHQDLKEEDIFYMCQMIKKGIAELKS